MDNTNLLGLSKKHGSSYKKNIINYYQNILLNKHDYWDYVVITACNKDQKYIFDRQLKERSNRLPAQTKFITIVDYKEERIGSGGSTLNVIKNIMDLEEGSRFSKLKVLVIHSGGDSKRVPQYSAIGKLFSPIPRMLFDGKSSSLFDEIMINFCTLPSKISPGFLFLSGDTLLLYNPFQIDKISNAVTSFSVKESAAVGINHGVFVINKNNSAKYYLHKNSLVELEQIGAIDKDKNIKIDTGVVFIPSNIIEEMYSLVDDNVKTEHVLSSNSPLSLYFDFLYPMATNSDIKTYLKYKTDTHLNNKIRMLRKKIWKIMHKHKMVVECLDGKFIHLGTTKEILSFISNPKNIKTLSLIKNAGSYKPINDNFTAYESIIIGDCHVGENSFIEYSNIRDTSIIGKGSFVSNINASGVNIPSNVIIHGIKLKKGGYVVRLLDINSNPKTDDSIFGVKLNDILNTHKKYTLWDAPIYPVCDSLESALNHSLLFYSNCIKHKFDDRYRATKKISLNDSFLRCDYDYIIDNRNNTIDLIKMEELLYKVKNKIPFNDFSDCIGSCLSTAQTRWLEDKIKELSSLELLHLYYYIGSSLSGDCGNKFIEMAFDKIRDITKSTYKPFSFSDHISMRNNVTVKSPLRINFGGGWSDTPPYCNEYGGQVLNVAVRLFNKSPIRVTISKTKDIGSVFLESIDLKMSKKYSSVDIFNINRRYDPFSIHKASLIVAGLSRKYKNQHILWRILNESKCGLKISCEVSDVPCGSGLGTSSILCGAMIKAIYKFFNIEYDSNKIIQSVIRMEQIMYTGGGWQDQVGGLLPGIKLINSDPGIMQSLRIKKIEVSQQTKIMFKKRFFIIFTGKKRMARNILRNVVGNYLLNKKDSLESLKAIKEISNEMAHKIEIGDLDSFAKLMNKHWSYSKLIDKGTTNDLIESIFNKIDKLICGKMICGAGGGGFIQIMLKKGISKKTLVSALASERKFKDVLVYDIDFCY